MIVDFNLAEALKGAQVVTVDGDIVTDLHHFPEALRDDHCLAGVVNGQLETWDVHGFYYSGGDPNGNDLRLRVAGKPGFIVVLQGITGVLCHNRKVFDSEQEAIECGNDIIKHSQWLHNPQVLALNIER